MHKLYLQELQNIGVDIIPTVFIPKGTRLDLSILAKYNWNQAVIKPAISAGSHLTKLFSIDDINAIAVEYDHIAVQQDLLLQPFMPEI